MVSVNPFINYQCDVVFCCVELIRSSNSTNRTSKWLSFLITSLVHLLSTNICSTCISLLQNFISSLILYFLFCVHSPVAYSNTSFCCLLSLFPCHYLCFSHFFPSSAYGLYALKPVILFWLDSCIPLVCWPLGPSMERVTSHLSTASYVSIEVSHTLQWHEINCNQIRI